MIFKRTQNVWVLPRNQIFEVLKIKNNFKKCSLTEIPISYTERELIKHTLQNGVCGEGVVIS